MNDHYNRQLKVERRKLYSESIRLRNSHRYSIYNTTTTTLQYINDLELRNTYHTNTYHTNNPIYNNTTVDNPTQYYTYKNYNEHGLISKKLLDNSSISKSIKKDFCIICQDDIHIEDIIRTLSCFHTFHINCVDEWFIDKSICPLCKNIF